MGSRITRALSQSQRERRPSRNNQQQAREFIKGMCSALQGILIFFIGFLSNHQSEHQKLPLQTIITACICSILMNASNPQALLIGGWILIMIQSLSGSHHISFLYNMGSFAVLFAIITNMYNYYVSIKAQKQNIKYLLPSALIMVSGCILRISHYFSHFIKILSAKSKGTRIEEDHHVSLRVLFCIMGLMIVMLSIMGHAYIRRIKFVPLPIFHQYHYAKNIKSLKIFETVLFTFCLKFILINSGTTQSYFDDKIIIFAVTTITALILSIFIIQAITKNSSNPSKITKIVSIITLVANPLCHYYTNQLIFYTTSVFASIAIILQFSNQITNQFRVNYIISIIMALVIQNYQQKNINSMQSAVSFLIPIATLLAVYSINPLVQYLTSKSKSTQFQPRIQHPEDGLVNIRT